jgi:hypothetical protein
MLAALLTSHRLFYNSYMFSHITLSDSMRLITDKRQMCVELGWTEELLQMFKALKCCAAKHTSGA